MPQTSFALMTNLGRAKEAAALANAGAITITQMAIGDGATVPSGGETALYHEVARKPISGHGIVAGAVNVAYFDAFLAASDGPYTIREAGLYDVDGDLIAIAHYDPPISKPVPASGQTVEGTVRLEIAFSDVANVVISVDPSMKVPLQRLTRLPWVPVKSVDTKDPPPAPVLGDTYVIPASATGAWAGQSGKLTEYTAAGWAIIDPPNGHGVSLPDGRVFERINGSYVEKLGLDAQSGKWTYAVAGGTANAILADLAPAPATLVAGMTVRIKIAAANTGAATLVLNGIGPKPVRRRDGAELVSGSFAAGQVAELIYDGTAWQVVGLSGGSGPFAIGAMKSITSSQTYTVPAGVRALLIEGVGGGGAGGGAPAVETGQISFGGGGGSGGYFKKLVTAPAASYSITIGGGGIPVAGAAGGAGGTTSFGAEASATGGAGGPAGLLVGSATSISGGLGGTATGGTINAAGSSGGRGTQTTPLGGFGGDGAPSYFGGGGRGSIGSGAAGEAATSPGAGGGGTVINTSGSPAQVGGTGGAGRLLIWELY